MVTFLLAHGADANAQANDGTTPLHVMVAQEHGFKTSWIPLLIQAGANVNLKDKAGRSPLHAVLSGKWPWRDAAEVIRLLVAAGADVNARDNNGQTPIHYLAKLTDRLFFLRGVPEALLTDKADLNAVDKDGNTPLRFAALMGNRELMKVLTDKGARPTETATIKSTEPSSQLPRRPLPGMNDLYFAIRGGDLESVKLFVQSAPELANKPENWTGTLPLQLACDLLIIPP